MIRILLVEDCAVQREALSFMIEEAGGFEIIATAGDGVEAVAKTEHLRPDIVLMDCHMPILDGIGATRTIMERCPVPIVITSATSAEDDTEFVFEAIHSGALAVVSKPSGLVGPEVERQIAEMLRILRLMSEVKVVGRRFAVPANGVAIPVRTTSSDQIPIRIVGIAGSTGAPTVIADILERVGPAFSAPILIVQHIVRGFVGGLVGWLGRRSGMSVQLAQPGMKVAAGTVYVAPDDSQMGVDAQGRILLADDRPGEEEDFRPSANYLFHSLASTYGRHAMGVLLTGMGRDGAKGLLDLRKRGGVTAVQDEASSVVFGMPGEAVRLGAAGNILPPPEIARLIVASATARSEACA